VFVCVCARACVQAAEGLDPNVIDMDPNDEAPPGGEDLEAEAPAATPPDSEDEYSD
jgi:hypothetical protein